MMCPRLSFPVWLLSTALVGWSTVGCNEGGSDGRFAISGNVTYDGQPVTNGDIGFVSPRTGSVQPAGTDVVDGHYEIPRHEGPSEGTYKVVIYAERPSGRKVAADEGSTEVIDQIEQYIPTIYNDRSTLSVEIIGDRDDLDFDLEKPKRTKRRRR